MGKEIVVGVVDGSGVLYDSNGIDREELLRLADLRLSVENFKGKLSGFNKNNDDGYSLNFKFR
jgi:glutamate dehydrogenase